MSFSIIIFTYKLP